VNYGPKLTRPAKIFLAILALLTAINGLIFTSGRDQTELEAKAICYVLLRQLGDRQDVPVSLVNKRGESAATSAKAICAKRGDSLPKP
jgi:hypothetical protein